MSTASSQLLAILRRSKGDCSDKTLSELLEVNIGQVRRYADNKQQMSDLVLERACRHAELDLREWQVKVLEDKTAPACTVGAFLIEELRKKHNGCSDYKLAQILDVKPTSVHRWRDGDQQMSDDMVVKICGMIQRSPSAYLLRINAEKAPDSEAGRAWRKMIDEFFGDAGDKVAALAPLAILALLMASPSPVQARAYTEPSSGPVIHYAKSRRRRFGRRCTDKLLPLADPLPGFMQRVTPRIRASA